VLKKIAISVTVAAMATVGAAGIAYADTASDTGHSGVHHRTSHTYPPHSAASDDSADDTGDDANATSYGEDGEDGASGDDSSDDSGKGADGRDGESQTTYSLLGAL